jgi:hypothetical protein
MIWQDRLCLLPLQVCPAEGSVVPGRELMARCVQVLYRMLW